MAEGIADCMPLALRSVGDAIRLDSENRAKEAYCQYLSCIIYISQVLKDDAWVKDLRLVYNSDTAKLFQLLQQCQERALAIISSFANGTSTSQKPDVPNLQVVQRKYSDSNTPNTVQTDQSHSTLQFGAVHKQSQSASPGSTLSTPTTDEYLHLPSPPGSPMPLHRRTGSYDPLDKVYQENKQLLAAYRARIQNANKGRRNQDVTSKNLSLMRRMSENLVIAKAREEAIKKKLLERQRRLQEETNRRFGPAVLFTKEQQEHRILYTKILEFEQETVWPKHLREKLKLLPTDAKLIKEIITKIFCSTDHPLTQFLLQYQYHVYRKLAPLVKNVGFPDVKSGRKASSQDSDSVLSETHSDSQQPTENIDSVRVDEDDKEGAEERANYVVQTDEYREKSPSESLSEVTINEANEVVEGRCEQERDDANKHYAIASGVNEKNFGANGGSGVVRSTTDLEKLKNLLDEVSSDTLQSGNMQADEEESLSQEETHKSSNLESYFQELEDEMFGWESSGDDHETNVRESVVGDDSHEIVKKQSLAGETNEGRFSGLKSEELKSKDLPESAVNDDAISSRLDSSEGTNECPGKETNTDDPHVSEHMESGKEEATGSENFDTDKVEDKLEERTDDDNILKAKEVISRQDEQCIDDRTSSSRNGNDREVSANEASCKHESREEASLTPDSLQAPDEEKGGQTGSNDQGGSQALKLPPSEESSGGNKQGDVNVPPSDEVRKQLKDILVDVRFFLEKLQKLLILAYEPLDTAAGRDLCYSCVEFPFFKPLWPMLLAVLRQVNYEKELCLADVMAANIIKGPLELGIAQRLCLEDQLEPAEHRYFECCWVFRQLPAIDKLIESKQMGQANHRELFDSTGNNYPYQPAVEELHKLVTVFCPLEKLECLVRTSRCICQCVEDYWESKGKPRHSPETAIGCDDLLPILSFVIIRSGMAQLVSECDAMEEFIPEGYLMGEEGYCLTTLLTALAYLATLKPI